MGIFAIAAPIFASFQIARQQAIEDQLDLATLVARDALRRADESVAQFVAAVDTLSGLSDPCSEQAIVMMAALDVSSSYLQAVGHVEGDRVVCASIGTIPEAGLDIGPPTFQGARNVSIRIGVQFRTVPGMSFLLLVDNATGVAALLHPNLAIDVVQDQPDIAIGVYSVRVRRHLSGRGHFSEAWIDALGDQRALRYNDGEYLVAVYRTDHFDYATYAAIPVGRVEQEARRLLYALVPIGVLAGLLLAVAVLFVARAQLAMPAVIKIALRRGEFFLNYQPIVDLQTGQWVGAEALIRWRRPGGEFVRPDAFIPVAEDTGLITAITARVMELVAKDCKPLLASRPNFHIAINLAAQDLHSTTIVERVRALKQALGARPGNIMVEATERGFADPDVARDVVKALRQDGVEVAIDDFGTGYSSLSYLETFEIDYLKIDKSFVDTLAAQAATSQVVLHIIEMGKSLKLALIAEGVETAEQAAFLRERGVQYAQGWHFAKPMAIGDLLAKLSSS